MSAPAEAVYTCTRCKYKVTLDDVSLPRYQNPRERVLCVGCHLPERRIPLALRNQVEQVLQEAK